jgi:hypothetical protein
MSKRQPNNAQDLEILAIIREARKLNAEEKVNIEQVIQQQSMTQYMENEMRRDHVFAVDAMVRGFD